MMMSSTAFSAPASYDKRTIALRQAWTEGKLRFLLHEDQKRVYDQYRQWEKLDPTTQPGNFPRVFVFDIGRRWGKTTALLVIMFENAIRNQRHILRYSTAYQKNIQEIISDVSRYVLETCPSDLRPKLVGQTFKFPRSGSEVRLVGLDMHPDGLRGQACDMDALSEAAFIKGLSYSIKSVLYPQYQGRPWARIVLESSAPVEAESDYDTLFVEDAKLRGAYVYRTIDDNPRLSHEEREEFIKAAGGREHHDCQREYFNIRVRDPEGSVVPEFSAPRHVRLSTVPDYAHCYVGADPGTRDKFGLVFGYWDAARSKLVIQRSWAERNASLADVAEVIRTTEQELWGTAATTDDAASKLRTQSSDGTPEPLRFWNGKELQANPHRRVSDTDARVIFELGKAHGIAFNAADKRHAKAVADAGSARRLPEHKLATLRDWILNDRVEIWPDSGPLQHQLNAGRWNDQRTDFERTPTHGHLDCMMALVYMLPAVERNANPSKPDWADADPQQTYVPDHLRKPEKASTAELNKAFGSLRVAGARRRFA
jgi:hypothetical protein